MTRSGSVFVLLLLLLLGPFSGPARPQSSEERHALILRLAGGDDPSGAVAELLRLRAERPELFAANNYDYLLGRTAERAGDPATAAAAYQEVVGRGSVLRQYALWRLSQIMRATGNLFMERLYLQELGLAPGDLLLRPAAGRRLARSHFESGNHAASIALLGGRRFSVAGPDPPSEDLLEKLPLTGEETPREDLVLLGRAYQRTGKTDRAREVFEGLIENTPDPDRPDDFALAGAKGLDNMSARPKEDPDLTVPQLSAEEHLRRAGIYQFNRNFARARLHYEAVVSNHPDHRRVPEALYQIGRGHVQERSEEKAIESFEKLLRRYPEHALAPSALYQSAGSHANLGRTNEAVARYVRYIEENPDASSLERAYLNIVDAYRDAKNRNAALQWADRARERFRDEQGEALALFARVKTHLSGEDWPRALNDLGALRLLDRYGGNTAGATSREEVDYLRGYALERLGRHEQAAEVYLSIPDGLRNYYGMRATERLEAMGADERTAALLERKRSKHAAATDGTLTGETAPAIKDHALRALRLTRDPVGRRALTERLARTFELLDDYRSIPGDAAADFGRKRMLAAPARDATHRTIADELLFLGLYDEAAPELETALREETGKGPGSLSDFPPATALALAEYYRRGDIAHRAVGYVEARWKNVPADYPFELMPRRQLELLYPRPYRRSLERYGREKQVDPLFVLSIMRQESRFRADVKSVAAARGLMQFISTTAEQMAAEMKIEDFEQDDLYHPPTAIRFGSHYIAKMFRDFPGQPPAVAAGYNGGEDRMARWLARAGSDDPDRYVPEIVFAQTKDYVHRVMANHRVYRRLYGGGPDGAGP